MVKKDGYNIKDILYFVENIIGPDNNLANNNQKTNNNVKGLIGPFTNIYNNLFNQNNNIIINNNPMNQMNQINPMNPMNQII